MSKSSQLEKANLQSGVDIQKILKLEQLFHEHFLTRQLLDEMISMYVGIVGLFGDKFQFMKTYFLEKMKFVLEQPEIVKILDGRLSQSVFQEPQNSVKLEKRTTCPQTASYEKKNEKINMQITLMKEVQQNFKNISKEVDQANQKEYTSHLLINKIAKGQNQKLQERLEKRKKRNRKKSVELHQNQSQAGQPLQKEQLFIAQRELTEAVEKFTVKLMERNSRVFDESGKEQVQFKQEKIEEIYETNEVEIEVLNGQDEKVKEQYRQSSYW